MKTPELLSPAGTPETAMAAFDGGADAVYCGLGRFNARERAGNFTPDSMGRIIEFARRNGKKVYLTLNTLLREQELPALMELLDEVNILAPDALIVQDPGTLYLAQTYFPDLRLHASTQMGFHNSAGLRMAAGLGVQRVILERQITLAELQKIMKTAPLEVEVFLYGSLCCSLSGRCLLSAFTDSWKELLEGVNIGGLGTPIASLASLITLKLYLRSEAPRAGHFMLVFTAVNAGLLVLLLLFV